MTVHRFDLIYYFIQVSQLQCSNHYSSVLLRQRTNLNTRSSNTFIKHLSSPNSSLDGFRPSLAYTSIITQFGNKNDIVQENLEDLKM